MRRKMTYRGLALALCGLLAAGGCTAQGADEGSTAASSALTEAATDGAATGSAASVIDASELFSDRDLEGTYDEDGAVAIELTGNGASCDSDAVEIEGSRITITQKGVYILTGTLADGQVVVDAGDSDKVQLVLAGADITSATSAAIYAREADKVFVTLAEGTDNALVNGGAYEAVDENSIDAVIFSKTDLTLNGSGSLSITARAGHGVVSKDDLIVTGGSYTVDAASHGLSGKDCIAIAGGDLTVTAGKDGLHAENADDESSGILYIADGTFTIDAQGDAISAQGALQIDGGTFNLQTGEGSSSVDMADEEVDLMAGRPQGAGAAAPEAETTDADTTSQKGIKGEGAYAINGGDFTIDAVDDCLHAGGDLSIAAGTFSLSSGDDAIHSDGALTILDGSFSIPLCYEGIEGASVTIEDGTFDIASTDDGINAAGGTDGSGFGGPGGQPQDAFSDSSSAFITINGGTFTIVSSGDCIDSNGDLTLNGGTLDLTCNGADDTALDCDGAYENNGGDVTTNDGSEENPGRMGGGAGAQADPGVAPDADGSGTPGAPDVPGGR